MDREEYEASIKLYNSLSDEEKNRMRKREIAQDNLSLINSLNEDIRLNNWFINNTKQWLRRIATDPKYADKLREYLILGAEIIRGCEELNGYCRRDIAHYTKYPLGSEKRKQFYRTKEGQQWGQKNLPKKN